MLVVLVSGAAVGLVAGSAAPASTPSDASPAQGALDCACNETTTTGAQANETPDNETAANETAAENVTQENVTVENASVTFDNGTSDGTSVVVAESALPEGGYVVVHLANRTSPGNFTVGPVIGNTSYLEAGVAENLTVALDRPLVESQWLVAMPHRDTNDNQVYEFPGADDPYFADGSIPVTDAGFVEVMPGAETNATGEAAGDATVGNETAANETAGNETVDDESASVRLPDV